MNIVIIIHIIAYSDIPQVDGPEVLEFGKDSVIIVFEWIEAHKSGVSYNIDSIPPPNNVTYAGSSVQLQLLYNTVYNVSTKSACGLNDTATFITLNYSEFYIKFNTIP